MLSRSPRSIWSVYFLLGLLATAGYFVLPSVGAQTVFYDLIGLSAVLACLLGIWWHRPIPRAPWILIALGHSLAASGDLFWTYDKTVLGIETPFPSPADAIYLGGTALLCVGVLLLAHAYTGGRDYAALIDTASLAIGGGLVLWTFVIDPQWDNTARPLLDRLVAAAYPSIDILILAAVLRIVLGAGGRTVALWLFTAALGLLCTSNIAYAALLAQGRYYPGHPVVAGWLLAYVLSGTLTLHPSMRIRPSAVVGTTAELPRRRLTLLALAALTGPALLALQTARNAHIDVPMVVVASAILFLLALGRLHLLASAVRQREARFRALVQHAADGVAIVGADGLALYQSPAVAAIIGYPPEALLGRDVFARIHADDLDAARQLFRDLLAEPGGTRARDLRILHADSAWRVLEVRGTNLLAEPAVGGIVINYRDITERASADAKRQASERQLRAQYEGFPLATMTWRRTGDDFVLVDYNAAAILLTSGRIERMLGTSCRAFNYARPDVLADFEQCHTEQATLHREYTQPVSSTGAPRHFSVTYAFVPPDLVMTHTEDVTERVQAVEALRASEERFHLLAENADDLIFRYRLLPTRGFEYVSPASIKLGGYTPEEHYADPDFLLRIIHPEDRGAFLAHFTSGAHPDSTMRWIRKDGEVIATEQRVTPIFDADGRLVAIEGIVRDVTARKAAEAALREEERRSRELSIAAQRQARELALLDQVRTALARELDPPGIHRAIVEATAEVFPHTNVALYLLEGDHLVLQQITGTANDQYSRLPLRKGIIGRVALTGHPVLLEDVDTDPEYIRAHPETVSEACVPLVDEGQVVGVLNAESADSVRLGPDDLRLLVAIGHHTSTALVRARLYFEARASAARLANAQSIAHLGSWEYDLPTGELRWSDEVFRIGGYPPHAFVPTPERMMTAVHPDDRDRVRRAYQASLEGAPYDVDHRIVRPDGEVRIVHQQAEFVFDASGRPVKRVGVVQDITERRSLEARLEHQAFHDPLTGLPNRALLRDRLGQALVRAGRGEHGTCAVLLLDLDRFKTINDSLGHAAGDRLLVAATARLRTVLRDGDTLARLGGDEFVVLLEEVVDLAEALRVADRLHAALDTPLVVEDRALFTTASIGVALRSGPEDGPEDLLRFADVALYRAKEVGRACTEAFYPGMSAATLERLDLEHDLRLALERNELVAYYQPKVDLSTGMVSGLEALVRWRHPERGLVAPGEFIPLAEETGLISPIGRWMLAEACRQLVTWQTELPGRAAPFVSVNLSARQFRNPDLVAEVAAVLAETGLPPRLLTLEVTETVAMARPEAGVATLRALKALGVRLALDDCGTGYSSLAYLQQLPVDGLKIDRAFFRPGERNRVIVRAVADLGRGLGLDVIAEGLETPEQVAWACEVGCNRGQGFYFSRPVPAEEIEALWSLGLTFDLPELVATSRSLIPAAARRTR